MLTLALLRHAKSSWDASAQDDFDRPLNERGVKAALAAGAAVAGAAVNPSLILCSPAARTRETLKLAQPHMALAKGAAVAFDDKLYLASPITLMEAVRDIPAPHTSVLVIGHNPGLHALAASLAGKGANNALESLSLRYPTAALAVLRINRPTWRDIRPGDGKLDLFWAPKKGAGVLGGGIYSGPKDP
jgi:phosphohistidine phosphatase